MLHDLKTLSVPQLAARWGVSPGLIREAVAAGQLHGICLGRQTIRIPLTEVERHERPATAAAATVIPFALPGGRGGKR